jgi:hypothetical protein
LLTRGLDPRKAQLPGSRTPALYATRERATASLDIHNCVSSHIQASLLYEHLKPEQLKVTKMPKSIIIRPLFVASGAASLAGLCGSLYKQAARSQRHGAWGSCGWWAHCSSRLWADMHAKHEILTNRRVRQVDTAAVLRMGLITLVLRAAKARAAARDRPGAQ